jgi:5-methylcytosine-specific restriction endonuclease McrA
MPIPTIDAVMLPLLQLAADRGEHSSREAAEALASHFNLSDAERTELVPSGTKRFPIRVSWARTNLKKAGLLDPTRSSHFRITNRGIALLEEKPNVINDKLLRRYPEYVEYLKGSSAKPITTPLPSRGAAAAVGAAIPPPPLDTLADVGADDDETGTIDPHDERDLEGDAQMDIASAPPERRTLILQVVKRNAQRARRLKRERNYTCERCEEPTLWLTRAGEPYVEVHHLIPLGENGFDDKRNLAVLCSDCHRFFHHSHEGPETSRSIARERGIPIS